MRAILCGGGTAGHVTPAVAICEMLKEKFESCEILFIGRDGGDENDIVKKHGIKIKTLKIKGLHRGISAKNIKVIFNAVDAYRDSKSIIKDFEPDVVIGTGGYVCWPVIRAAKSKRIPSIIHESNAFPGLTSRILAPGCDRVLVNFPGTEMHFKRKDNISVVGNPMLDTLIKESRDGARKKLGLSQKDFVILSFGGSGGAEVINDSIVKLMKNYSTRVGRIKHIHASGKKYYGKLKETVPELTKGTNGCIIYPYIENMPLYMKSADIVISRCGAMTLSEIAASDAVPILIPSPNVTDNHQYKNGRFLTDKGAAMMIEEGELCERSLLDAVRYLENNPTVRNRMRQKLDEFKKDNCRELIYREIVKILVPK